MTPRKDIDRRSLPGVAVMVGGTVVNASSTSQHCVFLSTCEAEYVAMAQGAKTAFSQRPLLRWSQTRLWVRWS